jgi:hypothetical protein
MLKHTFEIYKKKKTDKNRLISSIPTVAYTTAVVKVETDIINRTGCDNVC